MKKTTMNLINSEVKDAIVKSRLKQIKVSDSQSVNFQALELNNIRIVRLRDSRILKRIISDSI